MHEPLDVPGWTIVPFAGLLAAIALLPVLAEDFWHSHRRKALIVVLFAIPVAGYLLALDRITGRPGTAALVEGLREYGSFIILLGSLYVVAGGILIEGDVADTPTNNTALLAIGALLANVIGTTGASMVLIRFFFRINHGRRHMRHLPVFFIFTISNLGGLLTPLGDPPLFLGFLRGVDFFWTFRLWPEWLLANGLVLAIFYFWDRRAYRQDAPPTCVAEFVRIPGPTHEAVPEFSRIPLRAKVRLRGWISVLFLGGILAAVLLQSPSLSSSLTNFCRRFIPCPDLGLTWPTAEAAMILMSLLSLVFTPRGLRQANGFRWEPIVEVVILFAGIFVTMVPALDIVGRHSREMNLTHPWQFFWLTGVLSAFLDNAPTYAMFATVAAGDQPLSTLAVRAPHLLQAVSCGAVFLGALTYAGNGPNFMVKAIAEESGYHAPTFFGYLLYSCCTLLPIFLLITVVFFLR
jgi:Na+/H+ antiporter NhaD/arsenite permease-like protein